MEISVLLALLLVKTRASGTRNGLFEANIDTACITLSALPVYLPYRKSSEPGIKQKTPTSKKRRISAASSSSARCSKNIEAEGTPDLSGVDGTEEGVFIKKPLFFGKGGVEKHAATNEKVQRRDKTKDPDIIDVRVSYKSVAATYSPTWWGSTIGDGELNFSVRNGKRWILTAITATLCF